MRRIGLAAALLVVACLPLRVDAQAILWQTTVESRWGAAGVAATHVATDFAYATGTHWGLFGGNLLAWTARTDMTGRLLDGRGAADAPPSEGPPGVPQDLPRAIAAGGGDVFVAGHLQYCNIGLPLPPGGCATNHHWLERHSPAMGREWRQRVDVGASVVVDTGGAYVVGQSLQGAARAQKVDRSGAVLWTTSLAETGGDGFNHAAAFPGGGIVAAGASSAGPLLQRFDSAGNALWPSAAVPGLATTTRLLRVAVDPTGSIYAAGLRPDADRPADIVVVRLSAAGTVQWVRVRPGVVPARHAQNFVSEVRALAVDGRGNAIVAGRASTLVDFVAWTAAYGPTGELAWTDEYTPAADAFAGAVALDLDVRDHVYVGGQADTTVVNGGGFVRKLAPDGTPMWTLPRPQATVVDLTIGDGGEVLVLANVGGVALLRLDPGAAHNAPPPTVQLALPPGPIVAGSPITLVATVRGSPTPTGTMSFRHNGNVVCGVVVLQPVDAATARADCQVRQGLPSGSATVDVTYYGDMNHGAATASGTIVVTAAREAEIPTLSPLALSVLAVLVALVAVSRRAT